jgi:hypothetical protein
MRQCRMFIVLLKSYLSTVHPQAIMSCAFLGRAKIKHYQTSPIVSAVVHKHDMVHNENISFAYETAHKLTD